MIIYIGLLFSILLTLLAGLVATEFSFALFALFIDAWSFLFVLIPFLFYIFVSKSCKFLGVYMRQGHKKGHKFSAAELEGIARSAKGARTVTLAAGLFAVLIGLVNILARVPEITTAAALGANLSVSLIAPLYAVMIAFFIFFPLQTWAEHKQRG